MLKGREGEGEREKPMWLSLFLSNFSFLVFDRKKGTQRRKTRLWPGDWWMLLTGAVLVCFVYNDYHYPFGHLANCSIQQASEKNACLFLPVCFFLCEFCSTTEARKHLLNLFSSLGFVGVSLIFLLLLYFFFFDTQLVHLLFTCCMHYISFTTKIIWLFSLV